MRFKQCFEPRLSKASISKKTKDFIHQMIAKNRQQDNVFSEF